MSRPTILQVGGILYWVLYTRDPDSMVLKDADSDPTVAVRKNGSSVGDSVTVTKRSATTGIYDCSYNPASEIEGDSFTLEETAIVTGTTTSSATYNSSFTVRVIAAERGTDFNSLPEVLVNTTIATLASQTSFTLTAGSADDDTYVGKSIIITNSASSVQKAVGTISAYVGSTKQITLSEDPLIYTMAVGDFICINAGVTLTSTIADKIDATKSFAGIAAANTQT